MKLLDRKIAVRYLKNAALIAAAVILFNVIRDWVREGAVHAKDYLSVNALIFLAVLFALALVAAAVSSWWHRKTGENFMD